MFIKKKRKKIEIKNNKKKNYTVKNIKWYFETNMIGNYNLNMRKRLT